MTVERAHTTMAFHILTTDDAENLQEFTTKNIRATTLELGKSLLDATRHDRAYSFLLVYIKRYNAVYMLF